MARFTQQPKRNDKKIAGMYDLEERLGAGHFAEVKLAKHVFTGERVAVKVIDKLKLDETAKSHLYQEVRCMKLVQHPNIVRLYEVIDTNTKLYLVQELGDGGDMYDYIMKHERGFDESKARRYFRQMLQAIHYCHRLFVVHRDLKPENVIFFKKFDVAKLTDFGFSNKFMPGKKLQTACGSLAYSAPEILLGDSYDAPAVDVWSLGVILYMMVVGKPPFREANESETLTMILDCKFHIPDHLSPACRSLISRMIVRDVKKRAELDDIMQDPWTTEEQGPLMCSTIALANQIKLGQDQHNEIIQKMLLGDIADKETIKKCLDAGSYNHISATYYLLAEQVLRRLRWQNMPKQDNNNGCSPIRPNGMSPSSGLRQLPSPQTSPPGQGVQLLLHSPTTTQNDNLLMVADKTNEESLSDDSTFADDAADISETHFRTNRVRYHSTESVHDHVTSNEGDEQVSVSLKMRKKGNPRLLKKRRVVNVKSTPAFLNQISEERESDIDDSPHITPRLRRISRRSLDIVKSSKKPARRSSGDRRSSSMSSSSEDDTDLDKKMRRLSTERCRRSPKRRSDDEGEGEDEFASGEGGSGVARKKKMSGSLPATIQEADDKTIAHSTLSGNMMEVRFKLSQLSEATPSDRLPEDVSLPAGKYGAPIRKISCGSVEGSLNGRESLTWSVKEMADGGKENGKNIDNDVLRHILTSDDDASRGSLIRIGIKENGQVDYGLSADIVRENTESTSDDGKMKLDVACAHEDMQEDVITSGAQDNSGFSELSTDTREAKAVKVRDRIALWNAKSHEVQCTNRGTTTPGSFEDFIPPVDRTGPVQPVGDDTRAPEAGSIIEVLRGSQCTEQGETQWDIDRTMVDITDPSVAGAKFPFGGSDIDEIEMYMKAKEGGIELQSVGVRTIYNNPKVTRVTSNCCHII